MGYILQDWYVLTEPSGTAPFGIGAAKRLAFCSMMPGNMTIVASYEYALCYQILY